MTIKQKLITSFLVITCIPIVLIAYLSFSDSKDALQSARIAGLKSVADLKTAALEDFFANLKEDVSIAQDYYNIKTNLPIVAKYASDRTHPEFLAAKKMLDDQLKIWLKSKASVVDVMLVNPEGRVVYAINAAHQAADLDNPLPDPYGEAFENGRKGLYVTNVFRNPVQGDNLAMMIAAPIRGFDDRLIGVIALEIDMVTLFDLIQDTTGMGETGETVIGRRMDNAVVIINPLRHDADAALKRRVTIGSKQAVPIQKAALGETGHSLSIDYRGEETIAYWRYIPSLDWGMVAKIDSKEAFGSITRLRYRMVIIGVVLFILTGIAALIVAQTMARPLQILQRATIEVGSGNLDFKVGLDTADEIGQLSNAFDRMTHRLKETDVRLQKEIAERKRTEEKLQILHNRNEAILGSVPDIIMEVDQNRHYTWANKAGLKFFGEDVLGKAASDYFIGEQDTYQRVQQVFDGDDHVLYVESLQQRCDGEERLLAWWCRSLLDDESNVIGALSTARDITESKSVERKNAELQSQLLQTQKMQAIGTLAGGIAHDFNNILAGVYGFAELAQRQVPKDSPAMDSLNEIVGGVDRAKNLTQQILTFSRKSKQNKVSVDLRSIVRDTLKFLRPTLPSTIDVREKIHVESGWVLADPTQMQQVLMNLGTNAATAMREQGGILEMILDEIRVEENASICLSNGLPPGQYIKLTVRDTGTGISSDHMNRIFDPFFTTKEVGEGTGLGLSIVHAIVADHNGKITVESSPGEWTSFAMVLPRIESSESALEPVPVVSRKGRELVLLVDDEETITRVFRLLLERLGYGVVATNSSLDALEIFRSRPEDFDLLITDQTMPGLTGDELIREVLAIRADMPTIICTGFSDKIDEASALALGVHRYLLKPVSINMLGETIRSIFDYA